MPNCVICNKEVSKGSFSMKDKYELFNHSFICKTCATKIGITSMWSAGKYTAEKAKAKYFEMYPDESDMRKGKDTLDEEYIISLCEQGRMTEARMYAKENGAMGVNDAIYYVDGLYRSKKQSVTMPLCQKSKPSRTATLHGLQKK